MTDLDLLAKARAGDRDALDALIREQQARIYRFGMTMCRDPEDAKDILQETLLAMVRGLGEFRNDAALSTWLFAVARSYCIKKRRRSKFAPAEVRSLEAEGDGPATQVADDRPAPDESLAGRRIEAAVDAAIDALDETSREVLVLRDVEGLSAKEVAEVLGVSVQAVKSRLHRARVAVRERVAPLIDDAPAAPEGTGCPDVLGLFSQHLEGEISAEVCRTMEAHLATCAHCRGTCDSLRDTLALCRAPRPTHAVPTAVQSSVRAAISDLLRAEG